MATMNAAQVTVGAAAATGAIFVAPSGTALPTDATTALANTYVLLGFTSEEGVQISEDSSTESIKAWEGHVTVYNVRTEYTENISFTPIQCNADVAKLTWGRDIKSAAMTHKQTIRSRVLLAVISSTPSCNLL